MNRPIFVVLVAMMSVPTWAESLPQDSSFRVTTKIFAGNETEASEVHLILFDQGLVYDLPQIEQRFVTVFDIGRERVILLDRETKVRSTLPTERLLKITAKIRAETTDPNVRQRNGMTANVEANTDSSLYSIRFGGVEYQTTAQTPERDSIAKEFGQFADWAARLNILRRFGLPPFARMTLNDRMTADGKLPLETSLAIKRGLKTDHYRSTHDLIEQVSAADRKRISEIGGMLALYTEVDLDDFPK